MTEQEAIIARIAYELGADMWACNGAVHDSDEIKERFIRIYDPNRPCDYNSECLRTGRCPHQIACNN